MLKRLLTLLVAAMLLGVSACGSTSGAAPKPASSPAPKASASAAPASPAPAPAPSAQPAAGSASKKPAEHVSLLLDWIVSGYHAPYYAALAKGYFKAQGLDVTITPGKGSISTAEQVGAGNFDFGLADASVAANAISKGEPIKVVADWLQKSPDGLISLTKSHITKPSDLFGKSIAYAPGGASADLYDAFAAANHIKPGQITVIRSAPSDLPADLAESKVAAVGDFSTDVIPGLALKGVKAQVMYFADFGVPVLSTGLIVNNGFLKAHPGAVKGMVAAIQKGWEYAQQHPKTAVAILKKTAAQVTPAATQQLTLSLPLLHQPDTVGKPIGWMSSSDWKRTLQILHDYENVKNIKPLATYYTDKYVPNS